ncbi:MAG: DUF2470 domain-containing protein [Methylophilaceae bacterium]|nr:DUF2470 domain-containing protein [Methylophilaceae bacterium]
MNLVTEAKQFLCSTRSGVLSSFSAKFEGYPFGSVAPFVLDHALQPIVLISTIAEHTKNILLNRKISLLVFAGHEDLQASSRLTLMCDAVKIETDESNQEYIDLRARYCRYFPDSVGYFATHDFNFYRLHIRQARYIAGFGNMGWLSGCELNSNDLNSEEISAGDTNKPSSLLAAQETSIIEHMNTDHIESMIQYCQHFHSITTTDVEMLGIDSTGFDVKATLANSDHQFVRFNFKQAITNAQTARMALVAMSKAVRS